MIECIIPARLESTRFPRKVLAEVHGISVLRWCVKNASDSKLIDKVSIATPNDEIDELFAGDYIQIYDTSTTHNTCTGRVAEAVKKSTAKWIVNLQSDEPCVTGKVLDDMIKFAKDLGKGHMVQACYPLTEEEKENPNVVKAVVNNGRIIFLTRSPDYEIRGSVNLVGIAGFYVYDHKTIMDFDEYDMNLVNEHKGLDTLAFIGKVPVIPFMIPERTPAVDVPEDIKLVENYIDRQRNNILYR